MTHTHTHATADPPQYRAHGGVSYGKMGMAVGLTLAFVIGEAVAGIFGHSLALLSDAGHNFADAAALGFSWYALWMAKRPSNREMTFGYHRIGVLAALVNAVSLVVIAIFIGWEGIERLFHPHAASGGMMVGVAAAAVVLNVVISLWLHAGSKEDINVRGAYLHMIGDAASAAGVVIAGIIVLLTGATLADPIVSFLIAVLILWTSWDILKESVNVLLEGTPEGIDMSKVEATIQQVPGVRAAHDLHVWMIGPGAIACSVHIVVQEQSIAGGQQILRRVVHELEHHHKITHTTVQVEVEGHESKEMYCTLRPAPEADAGHHH